MRVISSFCSACMASSYRSGRSARRRLALRLEARLGHEFRVEIGLDRLRAAFGAVARILDAAERHLGEREADVLIDIMPLSTAAAIAFAVFADLVNA